MKLQPKMSETPVENYQVLRQVKFFSQWPHDLLLEAAKASKVYEVEAGEEIAQQGQILQHLYVIASGEIAIGVSNADGRRYVRRYAASGQVYGLLSILDGQATPQFYSARVRTRMILVPKAEILSALERHPPLWWSVVQHWSGIHRAHLTGLHEIAFDTLRMRLLRALLDYASQRGLREVPATPLELRLNQDHLANLLGMTRQSVSREVKRLEREGHIEVIYGGILLKAPQALVRLLEEGAWDLQ